MRVVARVCVLSLRASTACRARPRGVLPAAALTDPLPTAAGVARRTHGPWSRCRRPRARTARPAAPSPARAAPANNDGRGFQPKLSADSSGRTAHDDWSKPGSGELRSSLIPRTRLLHPDARCCSVICQVRLEAQTWCWPESYLIRRLNILVPPRSTSPRPVGEAVRGLSDLSNTS